MAIRVPAELVERDPSILAPAAGLVFLPDAEPGFERRGDGPAFDYLDAFGAAASRTHVERIDALAIPPAWVDVWISPRADGYLQAVGTDEAGRKQYRYHDAFRSFCDNRKFERLRHFGRAIVLVRQATIAALDEPVGSQQYAVAAAVRLIDDCLLRVGNHDSAANGHYGATTLTVDHVVDDGYVSLEYVAKSGNPRQVVVEDDDLSDILTTLAEGADDELFWFEDSASGERRRATATDINRFIVEAAGPAFSAKDFRTWGGSRAALEARATGEGLVGAADAAADELGNTRAVARSSYIHPTILDADDDRISAVWSGSRSSKWLDRAESALVKLLEP